MVIHLGFVTTCLLDPGQRRSFRGWIAKGFVLLFYRDDTKTGAISAGGFHRIELADISKARPDLSLRAEIGFEPELMQGIIDGRLDIAAMYTSQRRQNLELLPLFTERLVMVTSEPKGAMTPDAYIHVDWGPEFSDQFSAGFPGFPSPVLTVSIGWLGLQHLLVRRGYGYFPERLVERHIRTGDLQTVARAPVFDLPA